MEKGKTSVGNSTVLCLMVSANSIAETIRHRHSSPQKPCIPIVSTQILIINPDYVSLQGIMSSSVSYTVSATQQMQKGCARVAHASMAQQRHSLSKRMCAAKAGALSFNATPRSMSINVSCKVCLKIADLCRRRNFHQYVTLWEAVR